MRKGQIARLLVLAAIVAAWVPIARELAGAARRGTTPGWARHLGAYWPPKTDPDYLAHVARAAGETLAMSILGTVLALALAAPLVYAATRTMMISGPLLWRDAAPAWRRVLRRALFTGARGVLALMRSIPELVWAMFFVLLVGLGALPAVLALAVHTAGVFGKIFAELAEEARPEPQEALVALGARGGAVFAYGALGQVLPSLLAYVLYRWEVNIRMSAVFGFVGAGALGMEIQTAISWMQHSKVTTLVLTVLVLVLAVDFASAALRRRLAGSA